MSNGKRADADRNLGSSGLQVVGIARLCVLLTALRTVSAVRIYL